MTETNFRALCEELVYLNDVEVDGWVLKWADVIRRTKAALAQPEPVAPTDDELWSVGNDDFRANCYPTDAIYYARAVLARWGTPANTINQEDYE